ncbi:MAG TPA: hypothetical protein QGF58_18070 [Myxococcota bacterium]|nr:hypothetical protein [Myxococcota bacterium]
MRLLFSLIAVIALTAPAYAGDEDEDEDEIDFTDETFDLEQFEDDEEEEDFEIERLDEGDDLDLDEEFDDDDYGGDPEDEGLDFGDELDELGEDEIGGEGMDNVQIYRDYIDNMDDLGPEEELISWERYLEKYPNTLFGERIEKRMEEIGDDLYGERIDDGTSGYRDAKDREIGLTSPQLMEPVDPRTKVRAGVELGFLGPGWVSGVVDAEYQLHRQASAHVGFRRRYTGGNIEFGGRIAPIKSSRMNLVVSGIADFHYNIDPGFFGMRPQVAVGKRFEVAGKPLDVLAQAGVDVEFGRLDDSPLFGSTRYVGGFHVSYAPSDVVAGFVEGNINMKASGDPDLDPFAFNVVSFGLKFKPPPVPAYIGLNANVPAHYNFWGYHFGAVQADVVGYLDEYIDPAF